MASGSHRYSGSWARLPTAPTNSSSAIAVAVDVASVPGLGGVVERAVAHRADGLEGEEHRQHEAPVTDAVGDERLLAGGRGRLAGVPERDQEVRAGADALPTEERDQQVLAEHQQRHREHEQVQVQEELRELRIAVHVADRVQVDQGADPGDEQAHRDRQRIGEERHVDLQRRHRHPREQRLDVGARRARPSTAGRRTRRPTRRTRPSTIVAAR